MSTNSISNFKSTFATVDKMCSEIGKVAHLTEVNWVLGENDAVRSESLQELWQLNNRLASVSSGMLNNSSISAKALMDKVQSPYFSAYVSGDSADLTKELVAEISMQILNDIPSLVIAPARPSTLGAYGPTFLIDYPRTLESDYSQFVIKSTDPFETVCNQIYQTFCQILEDDAMKLQVPAFSSIDFEKGEYFDPEGFSLHLEDKTAPLSRDIIRIGYNTYKRVHYLQTALLLEKIPGQTMYDFVNSERYDLATKEQKKDLFFKIGELSLLDFMIGNSDRFVSIDVTHGFFLIESAANLGNALVHLQDEFFSLFLIDNGIDTLLCEHANQLQELRAKAFREQYLTFLKTQISSDKGLQKLAFNIFSSIFYYIKDTPEDEEFFTSIFEGILYMNGKIKGTLLPFWRSGEADSLKRKIAQNAPGVLQPLDQRINTFS